MARAQRNTPPTIDQFAILLGQPGATTQHGDQTTTEHSQPSSLPLASSFLTLGQARSLTSAVNAQGAGAAYSTAEQHITGGSSAAQASLVQRQVRAGLYLG